MKKVMAAAAVSAVLALSACAGSGGSGGKSSLTMEAQVALLQAEQDIKFADSKKGDTAAAKAELKKAQDAATAGDSKTAEKHANKASEMALKAAK
ncbi:MAG TPA: hypothetical protein VLW45_07775 [Pelomicrobium sp.]|nr:hypothetical protein [Pelomicrobium sp.]